MLLLWLLLWHYPCNGHENSLTKKPASPCLHSKTQATHCLLDESTLLCRADQTLQSVTTPALKCPLLLHPWLCLTSYKQRALPSMTWNPPCLPGIAPTLQKVFGYLSCNFPLRRTLSASPPPGSLPSLMLRFLALSSNNTSLFLFGPHLFNYLPPL